VAVREGLVPDLAAAVLDGTPIDWSAAESSVDDSSRPVLAQLRVLATLADVHRHLQRHDDSDLSAATGDPSNTLTHWGHLRALERIGRGAFGDVYRAWDTRLDREVALKLLDADSAVGDSPSSSIIQEGRLLARVRHPNVVTIYGAEQIGARIGLWMEFVRGRTLKQIVDAGKAFSGPEAVRIGLDLCLAVAAVHAAGVLHRDIKAQNVVLADDGRAVLMDFGTGRELGDNSTSDLTGTPLYVAPEILAGGDATVQSDIYSLGVLLYYLVTSSYPVRARTLREVRVAHERNERTSIRTARPRSDLSAKLARIIERASDPRPEHRYPDVDALAAHLAALKPRPSFVRLTYSIGVAAALILGVGLGWDVVGRQLGSSRTPSALLARGSGWNPIAAWSVRPVERPVIAVLPFQNLTKETDSEEFADGLTYEIHRNLAAIEGLEVRSATSSFAFKNKGRVLADIGAQLDADFVLEGSILQSAGKVRVTARLVRVAGDTTMWANTFDRESRGVFAIQDEISLAIVNALRLKLGRGQRRYETDPDLYYQFLKASGLRSMRHPENSFKAAALFEAIVAKDPAFAPAWAGLVSAASDATRRQPREELPPLDPRIEPAALRAIQIDPLLAEAHAAMGNVYARNRDWTNAEKSFRTALALNPSLTGTHTDFVLSTLLPMGKVNEALRQLETAKRVDPLALDVRRTLALVQMDAERYDDSIENSKWVLARDPTYPYARARLGEALMLSGRANEALGIFENSENEFFPGFLAYLYAVTGRRAEAEALAAKHPEAPSTRMFIYAGLGDKDRTFEALERMAAVNWFRAASWMIRPEMAVLRGDPRVADLRRRLRVPPLESIP
jgi:serine/threonine protein kinase/tetratricopeptide (TPR) repeat protein